MTPPAVPEQLRRGILGEGWRHAALSLVLVVAILGTNLIYATLNHGPNRIFLRTGLDASIPLVPVFAIPYVSLIPFIGASLLAMMLVRGRIYRSAALSMITAWFVSYAFYFFLQAQQELGAEEGAPGLGLDGPRNLAPHQLEGAIDIPDPEAGRGRATPCGRSTR